MLTKGVQFSESDASHPCLEKSRFSCLHTSFGFASVSLCIIRPAPQQWGTERDSARQVEKEDSVSEHMLVLSQV